MRDAPELVALCEEQGIAALARSPLGTGLLTGKHSASTQITDETDFRRRSPDWLNYFRDGRPVPEYSRRLEAITAIITSGGRTVAQGALAWLWARSPVLIPIPGARTVEQVQQNTAAMDHGPLTWEQMQDIRAVYQSATA